MNTWGEDAPSIEDIEEFGLMYACQRTIGNFAIFKTGEFAARGRAGTSPLYWNRNSLKFSFTNNEEDLYEFPKGHLYNVEQDRLVCWDPLYYDKPMYSTYDAYSKIVTLIEKAVNRFHFDVFLYEDTVGCDIVNKFIDKESVITASKDDTISYRVILSGSMGCEELFQDSLDYRVDVSTQVNELAKNGNQVWSPFFDKELVDFVLDATLPSDRPIFLELLLNE